MIIERSVRLGLRAPHDALWSYAPWAPYGGTIHSFGVGGGSRIDNL